MNQKVEELVEWVAKEIAESHGYVFPCGIEEEDDSMRYWAKRVLSYPDLALIKRERALPVLNEEYYARRGAYLVPTDYLPVIPLAEALKEDSHDIPKR